jgi:hypothetical protein
MARCSFEFATRSAAARGSRADIRDETIHTPYACAPFANGRGYTRLSNIAQYWTPVRFSLHPFAPQFDQDQSSAGFAAYLSAQATARMPSITQLSEVRHVGRWRRHE